MGQESLETLSIQKYLLQWEKGSLEEADKEYLNIHFKIGNGADKDKVAFYQLYSDIFCTDNCELSNWIWGKINGFFENPEIGCKTGEVTSLKYTPVQNITNIYNSYQKWKTTEW